MSAEISIFAHDNYKDFVRERIANMPNKGRGEWARIAEHLRMHPTRVSQIFKGSVEMTPEQACSLCSFWGMNQLQTEYFMALVQLERAGTHELKRLIKNQLKSLQERAKQLVNRVPRERILSAEEMAVFYSSWFYSAIRLATSIQGLNTVDELADKFRMSRERVQLVIDFMLNTGLCVSENGKIRMGPKTTHVEQSSPLVIRHHANWRLKAMMQHETMTPDDLAYTCPVSLRAEDFLVIREKLNQLIEQFLKRVTESDPPDTLACLTLDWFKIKG